MNSSIRSRISTLSRITMIGALIVAGLVIIASRLPADRAPAPSTPSALLPPSPIHSESRLAADATQQAAHGPPQPIETTSQPSTAVPAPVETPATAKPTLDVSHRIGILAGHWGYDSGAICPDGLREVDITTDIARRVAERLKALGYQVDLLQEQDPDKPEPPLQDYLAAAFVSLHVDSCVPGASGFKVSRWRFSQMPAIEDRFVSCLYEEYSAATGLVHRDDSITIDMWNYYAFREIGKPTPGVIIEMGFMSGDRWLLVQQPNVAAQGIMNGILCFLEGKTGN